MNRVLASAALSAALAGCQTMNRHHRVPDWPDLKVVEHHLPHAEMRDRCLRFVPRFGAPEGCTIFLSTRAKPTST